jgi:hypothetical protein
MGFWVKRAAKVGKKGIFRTNSAKNKNSTDKMTYFL